MPRRASLAASFTQHDERHSDSVFKTPFGLLTVDTAPDDLSSLVKSEPLNETEDSPGYFSQVLHRVQPSPDDGERRKLLAKPKAELLTLAPKSHPRAQHVEVEKKTLDAFADSFFGIAPVVTSNSPAELAAAKLESVVDFETIDSTEQELKPHVVVETETSSEQSPDHERRPFRRKSGKVGYVSGEFASAGASASRPIANPHKARSVRPSEVLHPTSTKATEPKADDLIPSLNADEFGPKRVGDVVKGLRWAEKLKADEAFRARDRDGSLAAIKEITDLMPKISEMSDEELVDFLAQSIVEETNEFFVLNKPIGLATEGGKDRRRSLFRLLKQLGERLGQPVPLLGLNRLDLQTSGCLLLGKGVRNAERIRDLQRSGGIRKEYLAITRGIPQPPEAAITMKLFPKMSGGKMQMFPTLKGGQSSRTVYTTVATANKCALVRASITNGMRHQVRAHLGLGLSPGCPVLGDHRYTYIDGHTRVPQRLPAEMQQRLGIRSSKTRLLPMYLHAENIVIPEYQGRGNFIASAPIPKYFWHTMKKLRLRIK